MPEESTNCEYFAFVSMSIDGLYNVSIAIIDIPGGIKILAAKTSNLLWKYTVLMKVKLQCSNIASIIGCSIEENTEKHLITATTLMQHNKTKPTTYSYVGLFLYH